MEIFEYWQPCDEAGQKTDKKKKKESLALYGASNCDPRLTSTSKEQKTMSKKLHQIMKHFT